MFYDKEFEFFNKNSANLKIALSKLKADEINKTVKNGQTVSENLEEAIRDCKIICRRIEILRYRFSDNEEVPKSILEDLDKQIFLVKNYKMKELTKYCGGDDEDDVKT